MGASPEQTIAALAILGIIGAVVYGFVCWVMQAPSLGDPWGKEVDDAVNKADAVPVCHHCFTPEPPKGWFCPECGAVVGPYCNCMPYLYVFSEGEVLRAGVTERFRRAPLIVVGYILVTLGMFAVAAPIYWFFLFRNLTRTKLEQPSPDESNVSHLVQQITPTPSMPASDSTETVQKCSWCGREYSEGTQTCPVDGYPLVRVKRS